ncbi:MAG TPA: Calx-beta domain-containing protein [Chitinispirillaceae bacterium]|nr:Calx-beta domain-containing protein [Chitinispirillaceae bacterium]
MRLQRCPEEFNNATIYVPKKVTSISSNFFVCMPVNFIEGGEGSGSPSIMFVIDHSGSMSGLTGNTPTDTAGSRFKVTRTLLDTIKNKYPGAEVGMVIFQKFLYFDTQNQPYAVPLPADYPFPAGIQTQGYIPLMPLDSMLNDTLSVVDMLKGVLTTKKVPRPDYKNLMTTDLVYKPLFTDEKMYTNINTAFDAAKYAMQNSRYPRENQFIIFLSDGEPMPQITSPEYHGNKNPNDYQKAVDVPTTFTVYFVNDKSQRVPEKIQNMTKNVRINGYSENNKLSDVWSIQTSYDTLLNVLLTKAITPIFSSIRKQPTKLLLNNISYSQYSIKDSSFHVPNLTLKDSITSLNMRINYTIRIDSSSQAKDTLSQINFNVVRTDSRAATEGVLINCSDTIFYTVNVSASPSAANEKGPVNGIFVFTRDNSDHGDLVVYFRTTGTATADVDYTILADSVIFQGTEKSVSIQVRPLSDSLKEDNETVIVTLLDFKQERTIDYKPGTQSTATVTIDDNFSPIIVPDTFTLRTVQNPFSIRNVSNATLLSLLPPNMRIKYQNIVASTNGILVSVFSNRKLKQVSDKSYGKAIIYDAVGNLVIQLDLKATWEDTTMYGFVWDGTNRYHRLVGTGTYLMKINLTNSAGNKRVLSEKLGFR